MAQQFGSGEEDGDIDVGGDDVVDADFEVVEEDEDWVALMSVMPVG